MKTISCFYAEDTPQGRECWSFASKAIPSSSQIATQNYPRMHVYLFAKTWKKVWNMLQRITQNHTKVQPIGSVSSQFTQLSAKQNSSTRKMQNSVKNI